MPEEACAIPDGEYTSAPVEGLMGRVIFITAAETGAGKTAVTALLLAHAQSRKLRVRALKPFSSGGHSDEALLSTLQSNAFNTNFFHYNEPIAPWAAARLRKQVVGLPEVASKISQHRDQCDLLLVEGAGGLLTPLGERFTVAELICELGGEAILVLVNQLGVLNQGQLCAEALQRRAISNVKIALVEHGGADTSRKTNAANLVELLPNIPISILPHIPNYMADAQFIRHAVARLEQPLAALLA